MCLHVIKILCFLSIFICESTRTSNHCSSFPSSTYTDSTTINCQKTLPSFAKEFDYEPNVHKDVRFYVNTITEVILVLLQQISLVVGSGDIENLYLIVLSESKTLEAFIHLPKLYAVHTNDLQKHYDIKFDQPLFIYSKSQSLQKTLWIPSQCSELPKYLLSRCNLHILRARDSIIHITKSSLPQTLILHNLQKLQVKNISLSKGDMECYCYDENMHSCSCSDPKYLLYITITIHSNAHVSLQLAGALITTAFKTWDVAKIISVSKYHSPSLNIHIFKPHTPYLILHEIPGIDISCWKIPSFNFKNRIDLCCKPKHQKNIFLLTIPCPENASYFLLLKDHGHGNEKTLKIDTADSRDLIRNACFSNFYKCKTIFLYNFKSKVIIVADNNSTIPGIISLY